MTAVKHTQHFLLGTDACGRQPQDYGEKRDIVQEAYDRWPRNKMGLLSVDWGIKCVASVNFYLLIPLLFYGRTWIMLPSMSECGGGKSMAHFPHRCGPAPLLKSPPFWKPCWDCSPPRPHDVRNIFPHFPTNHQSSLRQSRLCIYSVSVKLDLAKEHILKNWLTAFNAIRSP